MLRSHGDVLSLPARRRVIGDIILIPTNPPHIASVISDMEAVCEDGAVRPYPPDSTLIASALECVQGLESEVLKQNAPG